MSAGSLVPDGNSENVAVLLQEVQGSIPKLKQASDARSLCPLSLLVTLQQEQTLLKQQIANPTAKPASGTHAPPPPLLLPHMRLFQDSAITLRPSTRSP